jgi:hypothetical protein
MEGTPFEFSVCVVSLHKKAQPWLSVMSEADKPAQIDQPDSVQDVERLLLESASAIQRFIAERNSLRNQVDSLERESARLRHQTKLIYDSCRRLSSEFVTQLQLLDSDVTGLFREPSRSGDAGSVEQGPVEGNPTNSPSL